MGWDLELCVNSPLGDSDACTSVRIYPATEGDGTGKKTEVQSRERLVHHPTTGKCHS